MNTHVTNALQVCAQITYPLPHSVLLLLVALKVAGMGDAGAAERLSSALAEFSENIELFQRLFLDSK